MEVEVAAPATIITDLAAGDTRNRTMRPPMYMHMYNTFESMHTDEAN